MRKENNSAAYPSDYKKSFLLFLYTRFFFLRNESMANASLKLLRNTLNLLS